MEVINVDEDYVWVHDYHLLVLPSLLRKQFYHVRLGLFLHSPFPSSEIFRTFPKRVELLRSLLNADLIGLAGLLHASTCACRCCCMHTRPGCIAQDLNHRACCIIYMLVTSSAC